MLLMLQMLIFAFPFQSFYHFVSQGIDWYIPLTCTEALAGPAITVYAI